MKMAKVQERQKNVVVGISKFVDTSLFHTLRMCSGIFQLSYRKHSYYCLVSPRLHTCPPQLIDSLYIMLRKTSSSDDPSSSPIWFTISITLSGMSTGLHLGVTINIMGALC